MTRVHSIDITHLLESAGGADRNVVKTMLRGYSGTISVLTPGRQEAITHLDAAWAITACWFVYFRTGKGNPKKAPFTSSGFRARRGDAEVLSKTLDLCQAVFELPEVDLPYDDPHDFFLHCVQEIRTGEYNSTLREGVVEIYKTHLLEDMRRLSKAMKSDRTLFRNVEGQRHHYRLHDIATTWLAKKQYSEPHWKRLRRCWDAYKQSFSENIKEAQLNNDLKGWEVRDDMTRYIDSGNSRRRHDRVIAITLTG